MTSTETIGRRDGRAAAALARVLELEDAAGVLSIYVDADPALRLGWQRPARDAIRRLGDGASRARRRALARRLDELEPELDALLDPRGTARGRALFAPLGSPRTVQVELPVPLTPLVALEPRARALPLVAAVQAGRPAALVSVTRDWMEVSEWELGEAMPLASFELAAGVFAGRGRPGTTNPAVPQPGPERDRFERAVDARLAPKVRTAGEALVRLGIDRGWDAFLVDGEPRLVGTLLPVLRAGGRTVVQTPLARATDVLEEIRADEVGRLLGSLDGNGRAVRGPEAVAAALEQGRVERLLLDASAGSEELLRRALATGAAVTVVEPGAEALWPGGAAALLRW